MLVLLGAMKREIIDLKGKMVIDDTSTEGGSRFYKGKYGDKDIVLGQTGIGKRRVESAVEFILSNYPATAVVSFGVSGALVEELKAGDIVLGKTLCSKEEDQTGKSIFMNPVYSDADMISTAVEVRGETAGLFQVNSVTTRIPVGNPVEKLALGTAYDAKIVDMESYWIGRIASSRNIPFLSIRAVSDCAGDSLPPFDRFLGPDELYMKKAILYFLIHPAELGKLFHLYRKTRKAEKNLTAFMDYFIARYKAN
jgi:adenosylhomocysteine nucleosidase